MDALVERMPTEGCKGSRRGPGPSRTDADLGPWEASNARAMIANALGSIGDPRAVDALCRCATASKNPGDMFFIAEALGRIGGERATACLARVGPTLHAA